MRIIPLQQGFGAEVADFDLHHGGTDQEIDRLRQAYANHHLLIFRSPGPMPAERQLAVTGWFGPTGANRGPDGQPWTVLDNDQPAGSEVLPFHADISFMEHPIEGISLHPIALPEGETSTSFVSNAVAWDALPPATRDELGGLRARHFYADGAMMNLDWPVLEHWHPIRLAHGETGRPLLFVTEHHVDRIEGMSESRGAEMLQNLFAHLYAAERRYEHVWRPGDMLIWNNLAVQHARTRPASRAAGRRTMQRVALGSVTFREQLEQARQRQAAAAA